MHASSSRYTALTVNKAQVECLQSIKRGKLWGKGSFYVDTMEIAAAQSSCRSYHPHIQASGAAVQQQHRRRQRRSGGRYFHRTQFTHIAVTRPAVQVIYFQLGLSQGQVFSSHDFSMSLGHLQRCK